MDEYRADKLVVFVCVCARAHGVLVVTAGDHWPQTCRPNEVQGSSNCYESSGIFKTEVEIQRPTWHNRTSVRTYIWCNLLRGENYDRVLLTNWLAGLVWNLDFHYFAKINQKYTHTSPTLYGLHSRVETSTKKSSTISVGLIDLGLGLRQIKVACLLGPCRTQWARRGGPPGPGGRHDRDIRTNSIGTANIDPTIVIHATLLILDL